MADSNHKKPNTDQNREPDNAELQHKISNKQSPADVDKGSLSGKTSRGGDGGNQRANVSTNGRVDRKSVGEIGTDKQREKNQILNEQVKAPENESNK
jgi:hypothetical protein